MIVGAMCLSHSPLKDQNRPDSAVEAEFDAAVSKAAQLVAEQRPDITVIFHPDHINGFFYGLLPSFCIATEATSIGDYGTAAGKLNVPEARAADLARSTLDSGVDAAISYNMQVDHGAMQPIEWLSAQYPLSRVIPIFVNCAAPPLPTFDRARALGRAVGTWARAAPERVLIVGSGGLSHDPPMADLATAPPEMRHRLISGAPLDHAARFARQSRARNEGNSMAAGVSTLLPASPEWDRMLLDAFASGDLSVLDKWSDIAISQTGGRGGHETRTWVAALSALGNSYSTTELYYAAIDEWITGMGILWGTPTQTPA
ncbi:3-carboxyethylcatechol 2,3-dioxygenase [Sphingobium sp. CR2-8]|uniref:3-carboxyethylcatechol 2,3-dioxygenase n=1 Tax=Sphingobium sp. CR2-8 TaxID=1306534 RepID=UPI002DB69DFF|nr:3-carboxyethylcatechol 2,3-dioxygenase [Sphingobium sp. CR2-8]MEC3909583.1 3-carboxyethylcatechol 2,3-dioxygenase [Sphingobium sp. CR2-8]